MESSNGSSLKLHLASFRNHGAFHEDCTVRIAKELVALLEPRWLRMAAIAYAAASPYGSRRSAEGRLWTPDQGVPPYRGRG